MQETTIRKMGLTHVQLSSVLPEKPDMTLYIYETSLKGKYTGYHLSDEEAIGILWFGLLLYVPVNSYGHVGRVSLPNHTFILGKLKQAVTGIFLTYFRF